MTDPVRSRDRTFAPAVLAGLAGAGLVAVAGSRSWVSAQGDAAGLKVDAAVTGADAQPLVAALALVALAGWGVLLVLRGRARRFVAAVGLVASAGALVAWVAALGSVRDDALQAVVERGASAESAQTALTAWLPLTGVGAALTVAAFAVAVVRSPAWPAMGSRYDAPSARTRPEDEDMWRALDEGRDPTS